MEKSSPGSSRPPPPSRRRRRRFGGTIVLLALLLFVAFSSADAASSSSRARKKRSRRGASSPFFAKSSSSSASSSSAAESTPPVAWAVYSTGFATPEVDGHWGDWARGVDEPPAGAKVRAAPLVDPPSKLAAAYRPLRGPYSSSDPSVVSEHLSVLSSAGVTGVLTRCASPTVASIEVPPVSSDGARKAAAAALIGRQLLQQEPQASQSDARPRIRVLRQERATNATALATLVVQAARHGVGVGFVVPSYRHRNARTVRDDLKWCVDVATAAVASSAAARGALAARPPAARAAQPLAPLLTHRGKPVFVVEAAASIPCHHWKALLKPGGAFSVRRSEASAGAREGREEEREAKAKARRDAAIAAVAVAGAGAVSGRRRSLSTEEKLLPSLALPSTEVSFSPAEGATTAEPSSASSPRRTLSASPTEAKPASSSLSVPSSSNNPYPLDGAWFAEWRGRDDGDAAAACGFDGVSTPAGDDGADASDASSAENDKVEPVPFGAEPANWPAMRARAKSQGLSFVATVAPGADATPVRPWSFGKVRSREARGARFSRIFRIAALSGPDAVVVDSFNGWNEGTQVEAAASDAAGCGGGGGEVERSSAARHREATEGFGSSSRSRREEEEAAAAAAVGPCSAPDVRSYDDEGGRRGDKEKPSTPNSSPDLYMRLLAEEIRRAASTKFYELPRALASQEARMRSWRGDTGDDEDDDGDAAP